MSIFKILALALANVVCAHTMVLNKHVVESKQLVVHYSNILMTLLLKELQDPWMANQSILKGLKHWRQTLDL